jgi:hypothetical protein
MINPKNPQHEDWLPEHEDDETEGSFDDNYDRFMQEMYEDRY